MADEKKEYILYVYCRRGGVTRDAGEHARGQYTSDTEAVRDLTAKGNKLFQYYDEVAMTIKQGDRTVYGH